jgi:hypothetical protein
LREQAVPCCEVITVGAGNDSGAFVGRDIGAAGRPLKADAMAVVILINDRNDTVLLQNKPDKPAGNADNFRNCALRQTGTVKDPSSVVLYLPG